MSKVTSAFFDDEDIPELRFEGSESSPQPPQRTANYAATAHAPAYGVEADPYSTLKHKEENMLKLEQ